VYRADRQCCQMVVN